VSLAFVLELVDTSIKSPSDVARRVDLPLLGMVPHTDDLEDDIDDARLAFASSPTSVFSEACRQIRTCLLFSGPVGGRRSLLVTSPLPQDGRTTVALNLAAAIARGGRKVLVVDANFRQPTLARLFPLCPPAGLSSALVGQVQWREQVHEVEENLHLMAAGPLPPNPADLLGSEQMHRLIEEMHGEFEQVIFDGAPCVVVTDSPVLSTQVDGVVLVVRAGVNTFGIVQRTRGMLAHVAAHVLGVVLNGVRVTAGGYLRKNYETYYQYHQQPHAVQPPNTRGPRTTPDHPARDAAWQGGADRPADRQDSPR
jgi:capsular exopolysaccharide synthesis family protein